MSEKTPLYLIDSYGLIYRSYFAFMTHPLRNISGKNVSALFGFARTITSLLNDGAPIAADGKAAASKKTPLLMAAVFDSRTPTFRHEMYSEYKATRQKAPEDLHAQIPLVEEFLAALNVPLLRVDGFEADDIIATLANKCRAENRQCYFLSSDKDLLQLAGGGVYALRPAKISKGDTAQGPALDMIDSAGVKAEWGVVPEKMLDLLSLSGDASDNIPGVKGIGPKTAV
jgi:DNA polymerase-1